MLLGGQLFDEGRVELAGEGGLLPFRPGVNRNTRARLGPPTGIVLHWTGAENPPERVRRTLEARELSVDFVVDSGLGPSRRRIVQMADPVTTQTAHAGVANPRFLGIEAVSRGFARRKDVIASNLRDRSELDWATPRDTYTDRVAGRRVNLATFDPDALHDLLWLVETLCGRLAIPRVIPWRLVGPSGDPATARELRRLGDEPGSRLLEECVPVVREGGVWIPAFDRDPSRSGRAKSFCGVLGHFHVHAEKFDPGTQLFYALWREGFNPAGRRFPW